MNILTIHGAFSSPNAFNYIKTKFPEYQWLDADYSGINFGIDNIIKNINDELSEPVIILSHSMGGIIASNLLTNKNVSAIITIAAPLNGLNYSFVPPWFYIQKSFINEIGPNSPFVKNSLINIKNTTKPVYNIVVEGGFNPLISEANDGVVTVNSQIVKSFTYKLPIKSGHNEVLQNNELIGLLNKIFENIKENGEK